ncbi:hypothetical protein [Cupriavidus sp. UME77]|uniref:hypothetical protein n=1 Tax=Cupriavidus sp. UME77 TaxID=1862321 RepID=UPI001603103D|nr:hypothetical protein [Cupriavidus sp. UME77]
MTIIVTIVPRPENLTEAAHIARSQPERLFIRRRDAEPKKCAAGNGNGENGSHWSAIGFGRRGQTGYQHRPISNAKNSQQKAEVFA